MIFFFALPCVKICQIIWQECLSWKTQIITTRIWRMGKVMFSVCSPLLGWGRGTPVPSSFPAFWAQVWVSQSWQGNAWVPVPAGVVPQSQLGWYPSPSWGGTPAPVRGMLQSWLGGIPVLVPDVGYPSPGWGQDRDTPLEPGLGYPQPRMGTPSKDWGMGTPSQDWGPPPPGQVMLWAVCLVKNELHDCFNYEWQSFVPHYSTCTLKLTRRRRTSELICPNIIIKSSQFW